MSDVKRYDCGKGNATFCQGCYQMERDDEYGDWVSYEDYATLRARVAELEAERTVAENKYAMLTLGFDSLERQRADLLAENLRLWEWHHKVMAQPHCDGLTTRPQPLTKGK